MTIREGKVERGQWPGHETVASRAAWVGYLLSPDMVQKLLGEQCAEHTRFLALRETWLGPSDSAWYKEKKAMNKHERNAKARGTYIDSH